LTPERQRTTAQMAHLGTSVSSPHSRVPYVLQVSRSAVRVIRNTSMYPFLHEALRNTGYSHSQEMHHTRIRVYTRGLVGLSLFFAF
jgi:hypothetical protein